MAQFKAQADTKYVNPITGQTVSYTAQQLQDPAQGWLSSDFTDQASLGRTGAVQSPSTASDISGSNTNYVPSMQSTGGTVGSQTSDPAKATNVGVITSAPANSAVEQSSSNVNQGLTPYEQDVSRLEFDYAQKQAELEKRTREEAAIRQSLNSANAADLKKNYDEQVKTQKALDVKYGRASTVYSGEELAKLKQDYEGQSYRLGLQDQLLNMQIQQAYENNNASLARDLQTKKNNLRADMAAAQEASLNRLLKTTELNSKLSDQADKAFEQLAGSGLNVGAEDLSFLESKYGLSEGEGQVRYEAARREKQIADTENQLKNAKSTLEIQKLQQDLSKFSVEQATGIVDLLNKVPLGTPVSIGGVEYTGLSRSGIKDIVETNDQGVGTYISYNPANGDIQRVNLGYIGKTSDGWQTVQTDQGVYSYNQKTNQYIPLQPSIAQTTWQQIFPDGSQSPFRDSSDPNQGQCAAFCNDLYGQRILGDSFEQKKSVLSKYEVDKNDVQVGDTFLMTSGTTGHVGIVAGVSNSPDGIVITRLESNMVPPGGKVISSTEPMSINDPRLKMISRVPTPNLPPAGTDSRVTSSLAGGVPTIGGKPITEVFGSSSDSVMNYAQAVINKTIDFSNVPQDLKTQVLNAMSSMPADSETSGVNVPTISDFAKGVEQELLKNPNISGISQQDIVDEYNRTFGAVPSYLDAANNIALKLAEKKAPVFINDVKKLINEGDFDRLQDKIKKAALDTADTTTAQQVRGRDNSLRALNNIEKDLKAYIAKGGTTDLFSGSEEQIAGKLGTISDAERRKIATKIQASIADYRRSISGAAFTESEKAEYDSMFPSILNSESLNDANIRAMKEVFAQGNESFYRQQLGNSNYDIIFPSQ